MKEIVIFVLFLPLISFSQNNREFDSNISAYFDIGKVEEGLLLYKQNKPVDEKYVDTLLWVAEYYSNQKDFNLALEYSIQANQVSKEILGENNRKYAETLHRIARLHSLNGSIQESLEINLKCLELRKNLFIETDVDVTRSYTNIARNYIDLKEKSNLEKYSNLSFENLEKSQVYNVRLTTVPFYNLMDFYGKLNEEDKFILVADRLLKLQNKFQENDAILKTYQNIIYQCFHEYKPLKLGEVFIQKYTQFINKKYGKNSIGYAEMCKNIAYAYWDIEEYKKSIDYNEKAIAIYKKTSNNEFAILKLKSQNNLCLMNQGQLENASKGFVSILNEYIQLKADTSASYAILLSNTALCFSKIGDIQNEIYYRQSCIDKIEKLKNTKNIEDVYFRNLEQLHYLYSINGEIKKDEELILSSCNYFSQKKDFYNYNLWLLKLSNLYTFKIKNYSKASELLNKVENNILELFHVNHLIYAYYNFYKAEFYRGQTTFTGEDFIFYLKALNLFESNNFTKNQEYLNCLKHIANHEILIGNKAKGVQFLIKNSELSEKIYGKNSQPYFEARTLLLNGYKSIKDHDSLNVLFSELSNQIIEEFGKKSESYLFYLKKFILSLNLDDKRNEKYSIEIIEICKSLGKNDEQIFSQMGLANYYLFTRQNDLGLSTWNETFKLINTTENGDLLKMYRELYAKELITNEIDCRLGISILVDESKCVIERKFELFEPIIDGYLCLGDPESAFNLINLKAEYLEDLFTIYSNEYNELARKYIHYYKYKKDWGNIVKWSEKRYRIAKKLNPDDLSRQIQFIQDLVAGYLELRNEKRAYDLINLVLTDFGYSEDIIKQTEITDNIAELLYLRAWALMNSRFLNRPILSDSLFESYTNSTINVLKSSSDNVQTILGEGLSSMKIFMDAYKRNDENAYNLALDTTLFSIKSNEYLAQYYFNERNDSLAIHYAVLNNDIGLLSRIEFRRGNILKSDSLDFEVEKLKILRYKKNLLYLSENQQKLFKEGSNSDYYLGKRLIRSDDKPTVLSSIYNKIDLSEVVINSFGSLSNNRKYIQAKVYENDTVYISNYKHWKVLKDKLNQDELINFDDKLLMEDSILFLEQQLYQNLDFESSENKWISYQDIQNALKSNEVFIQSFRLIHRYFDSNDEVSYNFLIFRKEMNEPILVTIEAGDNLEASNFQEYAKSTLGNNNEIDNQSYYHYWYKLSKYISDKKIVYFVPDGIYNNINIGILYDSVTSKYLFEEKNIHILNKISDLFSTVKSSSINQHSKATLIGFPNYNSQNSGKDKLEINGLSRELQNTDLDSLSRGNIKANSLPSTKIEIETINNLLLNNGWKTNMLIENQATEEAVKNIKDSKIVHLATHGYFLENVISTDDSKIMGSNKAQVLNDPLLRSGLLFAGANQTFKGINLEGENGLLSADEATYLDLSNTELVVLSACETGRGEVKNGEGVYGLRKAFSDAGAKNIIMSLWKVDDKVTQEFMTTFYSNWLGDKSTIREAFNKTQLEIKAKYPQPYYWGAFILVGE